MRLSKLLGMPVVDASGARLGEVKDVRFHQDAPVVPPTGQATWRLDGFVIGGSGFAQRLGYLHGDVRGPWLLYKAMRWIGRKGYYVPWRRVASLDEDGIRLDATADELEHPYFEDGGEA